MKSLYLAAAALLMTGTAAYAGNNAISVELDGQKIRVETPKGCDSLSCMQITAPGLSAKSFNLKNLNLDGFKPKGSDDDDVATTTTPAQAAPQAAPAPAAPAPQAPVANAAPPIPATPAAPAPSVFLDAPTTPAPVIAPAPQPEQIATAAPAQQAAPVAPASQAALAPTTPVGLWATEDNKGNVRIEQCGADLCGYADKTGEKILINMRPSDNKWVGRIHDPDSGGNYDSTIAMKGPNVLKVQGCAFGGIFCGGQTWKRLS